MHPRSRTATYFHGRLFLDVVTNAEEEYLIEAACRMVLMLWHLL